MGPMDADQGHPGREEATPGNHDPAGEAPWAMQLAIRDDRPVRPTHLAVCSAAGSAVVRLLDDPRSRGDGPWAPLVRRWMSGRIRKVVRRGRGARFAATDPLDHVEVCCAGAVVRAFVPGPTDEVPLELGRLQVGGTDLPRDGAISPPCRAGQPSPVVTVALNPSAEMTTGKAAAQCGHAAHLAWLALQPAELSDVLDRWRGQGFAVRVIAPPAADWARLAGIAPVGVQDAGFTEVRAGTLTAVAAWDG